MPFCQGFCHVSPRRGCAGGGSAEQMLQACSGARQPSVPVCALQTVPGKRLGWPACPQHASAAHNPRHNPRQAHQPSQPRCRAALLTPDRSAVVQLLEIPSTASAGACTAAREERVISEARKYNMCLFGQWSRLTGAAGCAPAVRPGRPP